MAMLSFVCSIVLSAFEDAGLFELPLQEKHKIEINKIAYKCRFILNKFRVKKVIYFTVVSPVLPAQYAHRIEGKEFQYLPP
jgi:hypothetical protein